MKYGMRHRTIVYFQNQARDLRRMTDWPSNKDTLTFVVDGKSARRIAHDVIMLAAVLTSTQLQNALKENVR